MISKVRKKEILDIANRYVASNDSTEFDAVPLDELKEVDDLCGDIDLGARYRAALIGQIRKRDKAENKHGSIKARLIDYAMGIITGLILAGLTKWLYG